MANLSALVKLISDRLGIRTIIQNNDRCEK